MGVNTRLRCMYADDSSRTAGNLYPLRVSHVTKESLLKSFAKLCSGLASGRSLSIDAVIWRVTMVRAVGIEPTTYLPWCRPLRTERISTGICGDVYLLPRENTGTI